MSKPMKSLNVLNPVAVNTQAITLQNKICDFCDIEFLRTGDPLTLFDSANKNIRTFCSYNCRDHYRVKKANDTCGYCDKKVDLETCYTSPYADSVLRFCNELHARNYLLQTNLKDEVELQKAKAASEKIVNIHKKGLYDIGLKHCAICKSKSHIEYKITYKSQNVNLCSKKCFDKFCRKENLEFMLCSNCKDEVDPSCNDKFSMVFEGKKHHFCKTTCLKSFQVSHRKQVKCTWCSKIKANLDMIEHAVINKNHKQISYFCSLMCLTKFRALRPQMREMQCGNCYAKSKPEFFIGHINGQLESCCSLQCIKAFVKNPEGNLSDSVFVTKNGVNLSIKEIHKIEYPYHSSILPQISPKKRKLSDPVQPIMLPKASYAENIRKKKPSARLPKSVLRKMRGYDDVPADNDIPITIDDEDYEDDEIGLPPKTVSKYNAKKPSISVKPKPEKRVLTPKDLVPLPIPIPIPVYVPIPMIMFQQPVPKPLPIPVPVPVPMFFPTTMEKADDLIAHIEELKNKLPSDPLEADIFVKAAKEADKYENEIMDDPTRVLPNETVVESEELLSSSELLDTEIFDNVGIDEFNIEEDFNPLNWKLAEGEQMPKKIGQGRNVATYHRHNTFGLNSKYGLSAWFYHQNSLNHGVHIDFAKIPSQQLCISLCDFVENAKNTNGEYYRVDSLVYLLLGLQQCLNHNGRENDQLFLNPYYYQFQQKLATMIDNWQPNIYPHYQVIDTRVWEEHLWQSEQLGAHSPYTLLFTTVYFLTKYLSLTTPEELCTITFQKINMDPDKEEERIFINGFEKQLLFNRENALQCPVKLLKFYILKCPRHERESTQPLFLSPLKVVNPSNPVWYRSIRVSKRDIENMHSRVLMVKEVIKLWYDTGVYNSSNTETVTDPDQ